MRCMDNWIDVSSKDKFYKRWVDIGLKNEVHRGWVNISLKDEVHGCLYIFIERWYQDWIMY